MNLSKTGMDDKGAGYVSDLLELNESISILILSWNKIWGDGAIWLAWALTLNKYVLVFDGSFNNFGVQKGKEVAIEFSKMFEHNKYLLHIDISFCNFKESHAVYLNKGLWSNNSILGIHMLGNEATTDPLGFIWP